MPPLIVRGWSFVSAVTRWAALGLPVRTQAEIDERLAICETCEHLDGTRCQKCGCQCNETETLMNKLYLSSEVCPEGKWK